MSMTTPPPPFPPPPSSSPSPQGGVAAEYPAQLDIDYPEQLNRVTTAFRLVLIVPIYILFSILSSTQLSYPFGGLFFATLLMILFRRRYPRWWFDFLLELVRFGFRVGAYMALLTDKYPSTVEYQAVHADLVYPDVEHDLKRGMPLVKWFLAIPHYFVLLFLGIAAVFVVIIAWFAILFTGRYPRRMFDFVVGVGRWGLRVNAYAFLLVTDRYPPFSLKPA